MIMDRLKNTTNLTTQEAAVADYIEKNPQSILNMSSHELAHASFVSPSTIVRLCQKLGLSGYTEFKSVYTSEYAQYVESKQVIKDIPFGKDSKIDDIIETLPHIYQRAVNFTHSLIDSKSLKECVELMQKSQHIGIYGMGLNFDIARMYQYKLQSIGLNAIAYDSTNWSWLERIHYSKIPSFAIIITKSGRNQFILDAGRQLKHYEIPTLLISGTQDKYLNQIANYTMYAMTGNNELELSNTSFTVSMIYLLDILTVSMHVRYYEDIEKIAEQIKGKRDEWLKIR